MPKNNIIDNFGKLPLGLKLLGVGSFLTFISVFLPWYADIDTFNTGNKFIGLSGPLYLLGFLIMIMAISSFALFTFKMLEKKTPSLPLEEAHYQIFVGAMNLFLLVITSSIYFHSKFGVNITMKEMKFGMIMAFIGTGLVLLGGLKMNKDKGVSFETSGKLDRLIDIDSTVGLDRGRQDRVQKDIKRDVSETVPLEILDAEVGEGGPEKVAVNVRSGDEYGRVDGLGADGVESVEKQNLF